jgi:uncharacterized membrane protein
LNDESGEENPYIDLNFAGPLPPASLLQAYESIDPGSAARIIELAQTQGRHRQQMEEKLILAQFREARLGQIYSLVVALVSIFAGVFLALHGAQIAASIIGSSGLLGTIAIMLIRIAIERRATRENDTDPERTP